MEELQVTAKNKKVTLSNLIRTDGFTADVVLIKSSNNEFNDSVSLDYYEQDYDITQLGEVNTKEEVDEMNLCGIDLNRGKIFAASYGPIKHQRKEQQRMEDSGMDDILFNIPTAKAASIPRYFHFVVYNLLSNITAILNFNNTSAAIRRFHLYQEVQRAREEMKKFTGMFGKDHVKIKTFRTDMTDVLYQQFKRRQKNRDLSPAWIDGFRTSKVI
ncbi:uncharacterized protein EV154DRAFT_560270 [Mucor mucedo]|uniref:uncharacterized protein n=1 Tax=Mucor mucedo TaxID=29922 RepID=UPI00221F0DB7|nr:uncharacterized protein EV154DRAFT_560270 [Mucor mucedo]KAI7894617.1 hypothetical protein EV154DRAFT_560270 [Mucor mucedo]